MGLTNFKYETTIDPLVKSKGIQHMVPKQLVTIKKIEEINTNGDYLKILFENPFKVSGVYFLHFINAFYQSSNEIYILKLNTAKTIFTPTYIIVIILNTILFYLFLFTLFSNREIFKHTFVKFSFLVVAISIFSALPMVVETRYFAVSYIFMYSIIVLLFNPNVFIKKPMLFYLKQIGFLITIALIFAKFQTLMYY